MKRIISIILSMILVMSLMACSGSDTEEAIRDYLKNDLASLKELDVKIVNEINYAIENGELRITARELMDMSIDFETNSRKLIDKLEDSEVKTVHGKHMGYSATMLLLSTELVTYLDGRSTAEDVDKLLAKAVEKCDEYNAALSELLSKYDIDSAEYNLAQ